MKSSSKPKKKVYGFRAYGITTWFNSEKEMREYLMDWMMNTEGA